MDALRLWLGLGCLWLWAAAPLHAEVVLVAPDRLPLVPALAAVVTAETGYAVEIMTPDQMPLKDPDRYRAAVVLGPEALERWQPSSLPVVALFVTAEQALEYASVLTSAVYSDPPFLRQVALARLLMGPVAPLGVLVRDRADLALTDEQLQSLRVRVWVAGNDQALQRVLQELLQVTSALVAVPDTTLYSPDNIKSILISAYRLNRPMIGPGVSYLRVGALASTYSTTAEVGQRLAEILRSGLRDGHWPAPDYNPYFSVQINQQVGRSLNKAIPSADELARQLRQQDELP